MTTEANNKKRILFLEQILIPNAIRTVKNTHPANCCYQQYVSRLDELKLEYRERAGKPYQIKEDVQ